MKIPQSSFNQTQGMYIKGIRIRKTADSLTFKIFRTASVYYPIQSCNFIEKFSILLKFKISKGFGFVGTCRTKQGRILEAKYYKKPPVHERKDIFVWLEASKNIILPISSKRMVPPCSGGEVETSTEQISDEKTVSLTDWTVSRAGCSQPSEPRINNAAALMWGDRVLGGSGSQLCIDNNKVQ